MNIFYKKELKYYKISEIKQEDINIDSGNIVTALRSLTLPKNSFIYEM